MDSDRLAEIGRYYEEYLHGDPSHTSTKQAGIVFRSLAKDEYDKQSESYRAQVTLEAYRATELIPVIHRFLNHNQTKFATITPEKTKQS